MNYQKSDNKQQLTITEEASDFVKSKNAVLYCGCSCCCFCTPAGIIGGVVGFLKGKKQTKFNDLPKSIRRGFMKGAWLTTLIAISMTVVVAYLTDSQAGHSLIMSALFFLPAYVIPFLVGGLIGAKVSHAKLKTHNDEANESHIDMKPLWKMLLYIFVGTFIGYIIGIGLSIGILLF